MQAWVFRHLDQLRSIYGTQLEPGPEESGGAGQPIAMAPGTASRRHEASGPDVVLAPMGRKAPPGSRPNR